MLDLFHVLVALHIATGATGLVAFWIPVLGRKGGAVHRRAGLVFTYCMLATGAFAVGMSGLSIVAPLETHPHLDDEALVVNIFGWMMQYLAVLTLNLAWHGRACILFRRDHARHRGPVQMGLQVLLTLASLNCLVRGALAGEPLMMGMSVVGFATVATNLRFILARTPPANEWLREHFKGLVGAGISVYTAFFAFGAVRLMPELALNFGLWSVPLAVGLAIIFWHRARIPATGPWSLGPRRRAA